MSMATGVSFLRKPGRTRIGSRSFAYIFEATPGWS
jgi:hypothetical protein